MPASRFLDLPWELRRPIILEVLHCGRKELPSFNRELIESRVRVRNCFDANFPAVTNFYVPRHKNRHLHGNGLRATNSQIRYETDRVIEEELKLGNVDIPFVLDVMIVKEIGVFPTWMSLPYRPDHIKLLAINLRIIRPGTSIIPNEWIETARYKDTTYPPTYLHLMMAVVLYAFGCFSVKPDPALPRVQRKSEPATTKEATPANIRASGSKAEGNQLRLRPKAKESNFGMRQDLMHHRSDVFDAYCLSSASHVTDELVIQYAEVECDVNNKPIPPVEDKRRNPVWIWEWDIPLGLGDGCEDSRLYRKGCIQFGRDIFRDYSYNNKNAVQIHEDIALVYAGKYPSHQLASALTETIVGANSPKVYESRLAPYLQIMARSVGAVNFSGPVTPIRPLIERHPREWTYPNNEWLDDVRDGEWDYSDEVIERNLARELARDPPDKEYIVQLRILQARKSHGWILEGD